MAVVSVTELNQQTAKVLDRVKAGESLEVTEHGRPIARIVPILANASVIDRLVGEGRAVAATSTDALFAPVPPAAATPCSLTDALREARDAERF
jgi:prevent-host-death family protein